MKTKLVLIGITLLAMLACNVDERVVDNYEEKTGVFYVSTGQPAQLGVLELPLGNIVSGDIYYDNNNERLPGRIENVVSFRDQLYIFVPEMHTIVIANPETYKKITVIDFSEDSLEPVGISFPNSTDGYIIFGNKPVVHLLDITTNIVARKIEIDGIASDIDCAGNQIFVTIPEKNSVSVIDSRTHKQEASISVSPVPSYVGISFDGKFAFIVSKGYGKQDEMPKSAAVLSIIDIGTRQVTRTLDIGFASASAVDEIPVGIAVSSDRILFVAAMDNIYRMDYKTASSINRVRKENIKSVEYISKKDQLVFLSSDSNNRRIIIASPLTGSYSAQVAVPPDIDKIFSL